MKYGYARCSTADQNLERQIHALDTFGCNHIYKEKLSGKNTERPELHLMLEAVKEGDVVVVQKLDRLGRSLLDLFQIINLLKDKGVGFVSLTETIDTTSAHGRFIFSIIGAVAEFERSMILERVRDGLANARRQGKALGRKPRIDRTQFEADWRSGMKAGELAEKYKVKIRAVYSTMRMIKDRQKDQLPELSEALPLEA
jgi:DNA invertase Pin-like site-specific DNA recombinase